MSDFDKRNEAEYSNYHATYSLLIVDLKKYYIVCHMISKIKIFTI